jgi:hypothetical protein
MTEPTPPTGIPPEEFQDAETPDEIARLLRRVSAEESSQRRAFALLQLYRQEALLAIVACLDRASKERAAEEARQRLQERLQDMLDSPPAPDAA